MYHPRIQVTVYGALAQGPGRRGTWLAATAQLPPLPAAPSSSSLLLPGLSTYCLPGSASRPTLASSSGLSIYYLPAYLT